MNVTRLKRAALVLTAAALLGCGEPPLSPVPPPQADLIGSLLQATGLLGCTPMPTATATQTVGSAGRLVPVGPHPLSLPARGCAPGRSFSTTPAPRSAPLACPTPPRRTGPRSGRPKVRGSPRCSPKRCAASP